MFVEMVDGGRAVRVVGDIDFSVSKSFDCGQCFRFDPVADSLHFVEVAGVAFGRFVRFAQNKSMDELIVYNCDEREFYDIWMPYLSLDVDYGEIRSVIGKAVDEAHDPEGVIKLSSEFGRGIRILRQDEWETLCSFVISQNNNIPRIKGIVKRMCERYGDRIYYGDGQFAYSFPTPERIAAAGVDEIRELKVGFRAPYIIDAAEKFVSGEVDFDVVRNSPSLQTAIDELCKIKGVGLKVASCTALFGFGRTDAFPIDVWMKRSIERHFPLGLDPQVFGKYAGIAQQFLFYYERYTV